MSKVYVNINSFDALSAPNGSVVKCVSSTIDRRVGEMFVVGSKTKCHYPEKEKLLTLQRSVLSHWSVYGDVFELVYSPEKKVEPEEVKPEKPDNYIPFGEEWHNEMMKWKKEDLLALLREKLIDTQATRQAYDGLYSTSTVTRVEVIDEKGRSYVNWRPNNNVYIEFQDAARTLKVFIKKKS